MTARSELTVDTEAVDPDLVDLEVARLQLGFSASDDAKYEDLIDQATALIETYCYTQFATRTYIETWHDPPESCDIRLRRIPVQSIVEIKDSADDVVPSAGYVLTNDKIGRIRFYETAALGASERYKLTIKYVAGYDTIPDDLQRAAIAVIQGVTQSTSSNASAESERLGDYAITYAASSTQRSQSIPQSARWVLDRYRTLSLW